MQNAFVGRSMHEWSLIKAIFVAMIQILIFMIFLVNFSFWILNFGSKSRISNFKSQISLLDYRI